MRKTTHICDRCDEQRDPNEAPGWLRTCSFVVKGLVTNVATAWVEADWCIDCIREVGLMAPPAHEKKAPKPKQTLEALVRQLVRDEMEWHER